MLWLPLDTTAQHYVFRKSFGDSLDEYATYADLFEDGSSIVTWRFFQISKIDNNVLNPKKMKGNVVTAVAKLDILGKSLWTWNYDSVTDFCVIKHKGIKVSKKTGDIYVYGYFVGSFWVNGKQYKSYDTLIQTSPPPRQRRKYAKSGFILQLSNNGIFKRIFNFQDSNETIITNLEFNTKDHVIISAYSNRFGAYTKGKFKSYNKGKLKIPIVNKIIEKPSYFLLKLNPNLKVQSISNIYNVTLGIDDDKIRIDKNGSIILLFTLSNGKLINKKNTYSALKSGDVTYIFKFNNNLGFIKANKLIVSNNDNLYINSTFGVDNYGNIYLGGVVGDSLRVGGQLIYKETKCRQRPYIIKVDSQNNLIWYKFAECDSDGGTDIISDLIVDSLGIYGGGLLAENIKMDDYDLSLTSGLFWYFKLDPRGNILWMHRVGGPPPTYVVWLNTISKNSKGEILMSGNFAKSIKLGDTTLKTNKNTHCVVFKIHDIEIYRGEVKKGPYCAGDTLIVPYNVVGKFDTANTFIAQLSDENGEFINGGYELGRLKSYTSDTIISLLPNFKVISSKKYRIRILSTHPKVQSYYKFDSLRLLIYSTDSADAGADTTVCYGQQILLQTTGGTDWKWTPSTKVEDSTNYKTITKIDSTTQYSVIIQDSSGCGVTDTAYKKVSVLAPLRILNPDTSVCLGSSTLFTFRAIGGDTLQNPYFYQWLDTMDNILSTHKSYMIDGDTNRVLIMVLSDGCSQDDTVKIHISVLDSLRLNPIKDTLVCTIDSIRLQASARGALGKYQYQWTLNNTLLSDSFKLIYGVDSAVQIKIKVFDNCTNPSDSLSFKIRVFDSLKVHLNIKDTLLCHGQKIKITAKPKGGKGKLSKQWFINKAYYSDNLIEKRFYTQSKIYIKVEDGCKHIQADSLLITVRDSLYISNIKDTTICFKTNFNFNPIIKGGKYPTFNWYYPNHKTLYKRYKQLDTNVVLTQTLKTMLTLYDGCSYPNDTIYQSIKVLDSLQINLINESCSKDSFTVKSTLNGGKTTNYKYDWFVNYKPVIDSLKTLKYTMDILPNWVKLRLKDQCSPSASDSILIVPKPVSLFFLNKDSVCMGEKIQLINVSKVFGIKEFSVLNNSSNLRNSNYDSFLTLLPKGTHNIQQIIKDTNNCADTFNKQVIVHPLPKPLIKTITKRPKIQDSFIELIALNQPYINHKWYIDDTLFGQNKTRDTIQIKARDTGNMWLKIISISEFGCIDSINKLVYVVGNNTIFIPTVFSPNGDEINELFYPQGKSIQRYQIKIFNRWGELMFDGNPNEPWNGNRALQGTYIYMMTIYINDRFDSQKYHEKYEVFKGPVLLMK